MPASKIPRNSVAGRPGPADPVPRGTAQAPRPPPSPYPTATISAIAYGGRKNGADNIGINYAGSGGKGAGGANDVYRRQAADVNFVRLTNYAGAGVEDIVNQLGYTYDHSRVRIPWPPREFIWRAPVNWPFHWANCPRWICA